ncbi:MAG: FprA family A-type flavoprotein [Candidatus Heimdallarchaeota archaeon]|nr:FprA family A-type flavoprotein [Candidatus Heimdallarchaeota archaeon]
MNRKIDAKKAVQIMPDIWWVGWPDFHAGFSNNPYLIIDGQEVILIDPGSALDEHWAVVKSKIESIVPLEKITMVICTHQDPDICASLPYLEKAIGVNKFEIVTTDRTSLFIPYYNVRTEVTTVEDGNSIEVGEQGRELVFITSPYLHFPGAMVVYDSLRKVLFSSDIFAAFSVDWNLYANEFYLEAVKVFSQPYLSSKRHLINFLDKIKDLDLELICPQHGSLIVKEQIPALFEMMRNLEVGIWK